MMETYDVINEIMTPDTILPSQFFARFRSNANQDYNGERRLLLAVLQDALDVYMKYAHATTPKKIRLHRDANEWIFEESGKSAGITFVAVCEELGIEPEYLRAGLRAFDGRRKVA